MEPICIESDDLSLKVSEDDDEPFPLSQISQEDDAIKTIEVVSPNSQKSLIDEFDKTGLIHMHKTIEKKYPPSRFKKQKDAVCLDSSDIDVNSHQNSSDLFNYSKIPSKATSKTAHDAGSNISAFPSRINAGSDTCSRANLNRAHSMGPEPQRELSPKSRSKLDSYLQSGFCFKDKMDIDLSSDIETNSSITEIENRSFSRKNYNLDQRSRCYSKTTTSTCMDEFNEKTYFSSKNMVLAQPISDLTSDEDLFPIKIDHKLDKKICNYEIILDERYLSGMDSRGKKMLPGNISLESSSDIDNSSSKENFKRKSKSFGGGKSFDINLVLSSDDLASISSKGNKKQLSFSSDEDIVESTTKNIAIDENSFFTKTEQNIPKKVDYSALSSDDKPPKARKDPKLLKKPKAIKDNSQFSSDDSDFPTTPLIERKKKNKRLKTGLIHSRELDNQKDVEKELFKSQKEAKKLEKEKENSLRNANKRNQLAASTQDIIVQICEKWRASEDADVFVDLLESLGSKFVSVDMPFTKSMTFVRKVEFIYNFSENIWVPCKLSHETEDYLLLLLTGQELAQMIMDSSIDSFIERCIDTYPGYCIIILLEDLCQYFKRKNSVSKRIENQKIRNLVGEQRKINTTSKDLELINGPDEKEISETLLYMQLYEKWKCKIHICRRQETATWVVSFIIQIANAPRLYSQSAEGVGLRFGDTVKSGKDNTDTWRRMLRQIPGVSEKHSDAIIQVYPSIGAFFKDYLNDKGEGKSYFEGIEIEGTGKRSQIGRTVAARIAEVLLSKNPFNKIA